MTRAGCRRVAACGCVLISVCIILALGIADRGPSASSVRLVRVRYRDGHPDGHFELGRAIGEAFGKDIRDAWAKDEELRHMEAWTERGEGVVFFERFVNESGRAFPLYTREVEGMAVGARVPLRRFLVNQLREEISQVNYWGAATPVRKGHCTDAYAVNPREGIAAWGHNDDWGVNWRKAAYFLIATALNEDNSVKFEFGTWMYPGYLPGMQMNWNSYGMAWTANSLFPDHFWKEGVGTAWVGRDMVASQSLEDLIRRAANPRVSTAMNYNIGRLGVSTLVNLEVTTAGKHAWKDIDHLYIHTNTFKLLQEPEHIEASSTHREKRWAEMRPGTVGELRAFLSDRKDPDWPVYRNHTGVDGCYTQVTGIFDLTARTLSVWTAPAASSPPELVLPLDFPSDRKFVTLLGRRL